MHGISFQNLLLLAKSLPDLKSKETEEERLEKVFSKMQKTIANYSSNNSGNDFSKR